MNNAFHSRLLHAVTLSLLIAASATFSSAAEPLDVRVKNFPETQQIKGSVSIDGTTSHAKSVKREGLVVQTSRRSEPTELYFAGFVETDGFTSVSISLSGEIKSSNFLGGTVGVVLIPDEEPILRSLREAKLIQFPLECTSTVKTGEPEYFSAQQSQLRVAFPRYKIYLYNMLNRSVEANVYLYLSN